MKKIGQKIKLSNTTYQIRDFIGSGQHCLIYRVRDSNNNHYAVKHMLAYNDQRIKQLFQNQKYFYQLFVGQKQIVQYVNSEVQFLMLQLGDCSLSSLMTKFNKDKQKMDQKTLINMIVDVGKGLKTIHKKTITHRDIKPDNIIKFDSRFKILDFGVSTNNQMDDNMFGTVRYWAPQVLQKKYFTLKADVWSFGVTIFESFFGINPFYLLNKDVSQAQTKKELLINIKQLTPKFEIKKFLSHLANKKMTSLYNHVSERIKQIDRQLLQYICLLFQPDPKLRWGIDYSLIFFQQSKKKIAEESSHYKNILDSKSTVDDVSCSQGSLKFSNK